MGIWNLPSTRKAKIKGMLEGRGSGKIRRSGQRQKTPISFWHGKEKKNRRRRRDERGKGIDRTRGTTEVHGPLEITGEREKKPRNEKSIFGNSNYSIHLQQLRQTPFLQDW